MTAQAFLLSAGGLVLLFLGGEILLRGAVGLALRFDVSPLLVGLTIVALATSTPELVVSLTAGLEGVTDIAVGNVVGSNIANILLIIGTTAVIAPIATQPRRLLRDTGALVLATAVFVVFALMGSFGIVEGLVMLVLLTAYLLYCYRQERAARMERKANGSGSNNEGGVAAAEDDEEDPVLSEVEELEAVKHKSVPVLLLLVIGGLAALVLGSEWLVSGAIDIARAFGVSETVIGLTLVAVGTSLPELATAIVAGCRGHCQVALGNAIGSNIFNTLLILGLLAVVVPFSVAPEVIARDIWIMVGATILVIPVIMTGHRISRIEGGAFLAMYAAFVWYQFLANGGGAA